MIWNDFIATVGSNDGDWKVVQSERNTREQLNTVILLKMMVCLAKELHGESL